MQPLLSIIIVNHKTPELLSDCVHSLEKTILGTPYEIIIIDSESDGTLQKMLAQKHPAVRMLAFKENTGYAKAVNAGMREARGEYFLILNPDIIAQEHAVDALMRYMTSPQGSKPLGIVGPRLLDFSGNYQRSAFRFYTPFTVAARRTFLGSTASGKKHLDIFFMNDKHLEAATMPQEVDWLMGSALLVSRTAAERVGPMDERFFMYFEDVDWARRFWENGYAVVYFPGAVMRHKHQRASSRFGMLDAIFNSATRLHIASALKYFIKYRFKTIHYV